MKPKYLSMWNGPNHSTKPLADEIVGLFLRTNAEAYLIYEEVDGVPHHSERVIDDIDELNNLSMQIAEASKFVVVSDMQSFIVVPISYNEVVVIHSDRMKFEPRHLVESKDSSEVYSEGDWFAFVGPEIDLITHRKP